MTDPIPVTVGELREALANIPDDRLVVLAGPLGDGGFYPCDVVHSHGWYSQETPWSGDAGPLMDGSSPDGVRCVLMWPAFPPEVIPDA